MNTDQVLTKVSKSAYCNSSILEATLYAPIEGVEVMLREFFFFNLLIHIHRERKKVDYFCRKI